MKKLHYAKLGSEYIQQIEYKKMINLIEILDELCYGKNQGKVYLLANDDEHNDVYVTERYLELQEIVMKNSGFLCDDIYLQEYDSYEDAYAVALSIKEVSELCYKKDLTQLN